ncbi:MAG: hypothetical protein RBT80_01240 [Candidatus Vecturithrix sp.]|jgi:hypothetical protein|nr:hypothetical protein [Candidatus Vecturithrix sp.]
MEKKRQELQQKLEELKDPTKQAWEDINAGMNSALSELEKALNKAKERFE